MRNQASLPSSGRNFGLILLALLLALGLGLAVTQVMGLVMFEGGGTAAPYPGADLPQDYALGVVWAALLGVSIFVWPIVTRDKLPLFLIWMAKSVVVLGVMLVYEHTYGVDPDGYFTNAVVNPFVWTGFTPGSGTENVQHLAWLQNHIVPNSYTASKISFAIIGLIAVYLFYRAGVLLVRREHPYVLYAVALYPSILFWSAILGKEPIVFLGIAIYTYGVVGWYRFRQMGYIALLGSGVLIAIFIRIWLGPILILPMFPMFFLGLRRSHARVLQGVVWTLLALLALYFCVGLVQERWNIQSVTDVLPLATAISQSFDNSSAGSGLVAPDFNSYSDLLTFLPWGVFTVLFRPLPGDLINTFGLIASTENVVLLVLFVRAVVRTRLRELREPMVRWAVGLIGIWGILYSIGIYQNLGTLVRHRLEILPVMLALLVYLGRRRSLSTSLILSSDIDPM